MPFGLARRCRRDPPGPTKTKLAKSQWREQVEAYCIPYVSSGSYDLGREATLLLAFDSSMKNLYKNFCPIMILLILGPYSILATCFFKVQVNGRTITNAVTCININYQRQPKAL
ncbi:uncharacterized protein F5147DRAFT_650300 [Suillus discolor]|uniref:Uncharacterized protein n=1 Tax=Suillus discolor TaxID=1912936 RepID=A0A9P7FF79_9AGAM|nr:uncharacterized protein F5147DRAFT_650300 [Suillus discolor]KAG2113905.1 hypothetical protein F5147DRAFT_650300 [Suillus discolor]